MPDPGLLPDDIRGITLLNAPPLRYESFDADVDRIARKVLGLAAGELVWDKAPLGRRLWSAAGGAFLAGVALLAAALAHNYFLHRPISTSIGEEQTTLLIARGAHFRAYRGAPPWLKAAAALELIRFRWNQRLALSFRFIVRLYRKTASRFFRTRSRKLGAAFHVTNVSGVSPYRNCTTAPILRH